MHFFKLGYQVAQLVFVVSVQRLVVQAKLLAPAVNAQHIGFTVLAPAYFPGHGDDLFAHFVAGLGHKLTVWVYTIATPVHTA